MKSNLKLQLIFSNRAGITADVASLFSQQSVNISFFEMGVRTDQAIASLDVEGTETTEWDFCLDRRRSIPDLKEVFTID